MIADDGRLLARRDSEVEPAAYTLFGFQWGSLKGRLVFGTIRGNRPSVNKVELEKRRKGEAIGWSARTSATSTSALTELIGVGHEIE